MVTKIAKALYFILQSCGHCGSGGGGGHCSGLPSKTKTRK